MKFSIASALILGSIVVSAIPMDGAHLKRGEVSIAGKPSVTAAPTPLGKHKTRRTCPRSKKPHAPGGGKPSYIVSGSKTISTVIPRPTSISHSGVPTTTVPLPSTIGTPNPSPSATAPESLTTTSTKTSATGSSTAVPSPSPSTGVPPSIPVGQWIYTCNNPGQIALTFDDGPGEKTSKLVGLLNDAGMKATFFLNANNWVGDISGNAQYTAILKNMVDSGHQIGSHTYSHENLDKSTADQIKDTMGKVDTWLQGAIGKKPTYMRPPYFACETPTCQSTIKELGYHMFNANLDTKDYENNTPEKITTAINTFDTAVLGADNTSDSFVVLMHDVHATTVDILVPAIIETIKTSGFKAVTLGECLGDPAANWYH